MKLTNKTYTFHSDAGHGWLAVKRKDLETLGILKDITIFSYQKGNTIYLEEDVDAGLFIKEFQNRFGIGPKIKEGKNYSIGNRPHPIRNYQRFVK